MYCHFCSFCYFHSCHCYCCTTISLRYLSFLAHCVGNKSFLLLSCFVHILFHLKLLLSTYLLLFLAQYLFHSLPCLTWLDNRQAPFPHTSSNQNQPTNQSRQHSRSKKRVRWVTVSGTLDSSKPTLSSYNSTSIEHTYLPTYAVSTWLGLRVSVYAQRCRPSHFISSSCIFKSCCLSAISQTYLPFLVASLVSTPTSLPPSVFHSHQWGADFCSQRVICICHSFSHKT